MPETGFHQSRQISPTGLAIVIAMHGAAITALIVAKGPQFVPTDYAETEVRLIPIQPDPPPERQPEPEPRTEPQQRRSVVETVPPIVPSPPRDNSLQTLPLPPQPYDPLPPGDVITPDPPVRPQPRLEPQPQPEPVRVEAQFARSAELQPPYPASEERMGNEGNVTIRVTIGTDGRVVSAERVRATSDAFWRATERHARSRWRFRPATVDGRPVESRKTLTVHFTLTD